MFSVARSIFKFDWNNNDKIYNSCDYFLFFDYFIISREKDKTTVFCCDVLVIAGSLLFLQIDISVLYNSQYAYVVAALLAKSILLYSCIMFSKKIEASRRHEKFSILEWGQLLIVPICMILNLCMI